MSGLLPLSRAAHIIGASRSQLQAKIASGELASSEGMVSIEDLQRVYPDAQLEHGGCIERISQIREEAFGKRMRARILPNQEVLAERLAAQGEEMEDLRRHLARYHDLVEALQERLQALAAQGRDGEGVAAQLLGLVDEGLAEVLASDAAPDGVAVMNNVLQVVSSHVRVKPSGREFYVVGDESLLEAALRAGLAPPYGCGSGNCGLCKARVISGRVQRLNDGDHVLTSVEKRLGYTLMCSYTAVTDLVIELLEAESPQDIPRQDIVARVKDVAVAADGAVRILRLQTPKSSRLRFMAGQRAVLSASTASGEVRGEYSLASCPCDGRNLEFHIQRDGEDDFASRLFAGAMARDDAVSVFAPFGDFVLPAAAGAVLIACDVGFAPLQGIVEHALAAERPQRLHLLWLATQPQGHYRENRCRAWAAAMDGFSHQLLTAADAASAAAAAVAALQARAVANSSSWPHLVAGQQAFVAAVSAAAAAAGLDTQAWRFETV